MILVSESEKKNRLSRIINALLLNSSFLDEIGLMHGKMGISIFFFNLARTTGNNMYYDYAGELIDEIYEEVSISTSWDFEKGLAGIGWGIEYLAQNGFIEADTDEVLQEFDNRLFQILSINPPKKIGLLDGLMGLGVYFLKRVQNPVTSDENISTLINKQTLIHIIDELERRIQDLSHIISEPEEERINRDTIEDHAKVGKTFNIFWNYPVLIQFFTEMNELQLFNYKSDSIIKRLIEPIKDYENFPKMHSNRLLLVLALSKLIQTEAILDTMQLKHLKEVSNTLLSDVDRNKVKSELASKNSTIKSGTSGIALIYWQLYKLSNSEIFLKEMRYWVNQSFSIYEKEYTYTGCEIGSATRFFGFYEGLTGIGQIANAYNIPM